MHKNVSLFKEIPNIVISPEFNELNKGNMTIYIS